MTVWQKFVKKLLQQNEMQDVRIWGKIEGVAKSHCNKNDEYRKFYELNCINQIKVETEKKEM